LVVVGVVFIDNFDDLAQLSKGRGCKQRRIIIRRERRGKTEREKEERNEPEFQILHCLLQR
jgi:hypothetical protein